jgi:hypothetical protein
MNTDAQTAALRLLFVRRLCAFRWASIDMPMEASRVGLGLLHNCIGPFAERLTLAITEIVRLRSESSVFVFTVTSYRSSRVSFLAPSPPLR